MKYFIALGLLLCVIVAVVYFLFFSGHDVDIRKVEYPPLKLFFRNRKINGFHGIHYYSETNKEHLWSVFFRDTPAMSAITYGVLPSRTEQEFPKTGKPRPFKPGEKILVELAFQYDELMAPCVGSKTWAFEVEGDERIKALGESLHAFIPVRKVVDAEQEKSPW